MAWIDKHKRIRGYGHNDSVHRVERVKCKQMTSSTWPLLLSEARHASEEGGRGRDFSLVLVKRRGR